MREIKFRGKDKDNNWVTGDLIHGVNTKKGNLYILPLEHNLAHIPNCHYLDGVKIENETIGQFTGLRDKNGIDIYEGDQLHICAGYSSVVEFQDAMFVSVYSHPEDGETIPLLDVIEYADAHVIGNIHDNSELLNK